MTSHSSGKNKAMDFQEMLEQIQVEYRSKIQKALEEAIGVALSMFEADIRNPTLNDLSKAGITADTFMLRANSVGLALFDNGLFSAAERLYRTLAQRTMEYRDATKERRHVGVFYANTAAAWFAQGNSDQGIIDLLRAAQDDVPTYSLKEIKDSYALTDLLPHYFGKRVQETALKIAKRVNGGLALTDVQDLCRLLDNQQFFRDYIFLAYVDLAQEHTVVNQHTPNEFSQLQVFSALRSVAAIFEIQLKSTL